MPVYIVSDLHGAVDDLRKAVPEGATLLLLGDLLNLLDYITMTRDPGRGLLGRSSR